MTEMYLYRAIELLADMVENNIFLLFIGIFVAKDKIGTEWKRIVLYGCLIGGFGFICDQVALMSVIKALLQLSVIVIACKYIFQCRIRDSLLWGIICLTLIVAYEYLLILFIQYVIGINLNNYFIYSSVRANTIVAAKATELFVILAVYQNSKRKKVYLNNKLIPLIICVCIVIALLVVFFFASRFSEDYREIANLIYSLVTLVFVILFVLFMIMISETAQRQKEFETMQLKNQVLEKNLQETKTAYMHWEKSIHDYKNIVLSLHSMLEQSGQEDAISFLKEEMNQMEKEHHVIHCGNAMLDSVISVKWSDAEEKGIYVSLQGSLREGLPVSEVDLGRMVGNLMDNAIEGATLGDGEWKYIEVLLSQDDAILEITVRNSTCMHNIDFTTTKKDKKRHGLGLQSIREIAAKYNGSFTIIQNENVVEAAICIPVFTN